MVESPKAREDEDEEEEKINWRKRIAKAPQKEIALGCGRDQHRD